MCSVKSKTGTLYEDYIRPSMTWHQRLNCLLNFHEVQCRSSLQEVIEQTRVSWKSVFWHTLLGGVN